jgi:hypothetical protein
MLLLPIFTGELLPLNKGLTSNITGNEPFFIFENQWENAAPVADMNIDTGMDGQMFALNLQRMWFLRNFTLTVT